MVYSVISLFAWSTKILQFRIHATCFALFCVLCLIHRIIAGSFTNGMVAVWDIATESPLLSKRVGKSCILYPYHSFQAHIGVVSGMTGVRDLASQHTSCLKRSTAVLVHVHQKFYSHLHEIESFQHLSSKSLTLLLHISTVIEAQWDSEKSEYPRKSSAKNVQCNVRPFKSWVFCRIHLAVNSCSKEFSMLIASMQHLLSLFISCITKKGCYLLFAHRKHPFSFVHMILHAAQLSLVLAGLLMVTYVNTMQSW